MADTERSVSMSTTRNKPPPVPPARSDSLSVHPRRGAASHGQHQQPVAPARHTHQPQQLLPSAQDELRKKLLARSASQVHAGEESTVDDLPPPPPELQMTPQELRAKDEDEFERLVQQQGLLGALGFSSGPRSPDTGRKTPPRRPQTPPQRRGSSTAVDRPHRPPPPHAQPAKPPRPRAPQRAVGGEGGDQHQGPALTPKRQLLPQKKREPAPVPTPPSSHYQHNGHHQHHQHQQQQQQQQHEHAPPAHGTTTDTAVADGQHIKAPPPPQAATARPPPPARRPGDASRPPAPPEPPARAASKPTAAEAAAVDISTRINNKAALLGKPPRRLSFSDTPEVVETYATNEYDRSNEKLNVEAALEDSDRESLAARLRQELEEDYDFVTATLVLGDDQGVGIGLRGQPISDPAHPSTASKGTASTNPFATDSTRGLVSMVVSGLVEGGAAYDNGNVYVGDVLVSLDDEGLLATTHERAVDRLQACQGRVRVVLARKRGLKRTAPTASGTQAENQGQRSEEQPSPQQRMGSEQEHRDTVAEQAAEIERLKEEVERVTSQLQVVQTAATNAGQALEQKEDTVADLRRRLDTTKKEAQHAEREKEQLKEAVDEQRRAAAAASRRAEQAEARVREAKATAVQDSQRREHNSTEATQQENTQLKRQLEQEKARREDLESRVADLEKQLAAAAAGGPEDGNNPAPKPPATAATAGATTSARPPTNTTTAASAGASDSAPVAPPRPAHRPGSPASTARATASASRAAAAAAASRAPAPHPQPKPKPKPKVVPKPVVEPKPRAHGPGEGAGPDAKHTEVTATGGAGAASAGSGAHGGAPVPPVRPRPRPRAHTAAPATKPRRKGSDDHGKAASAAGATGENVTDLFEAISDSASGTLDVRANRDRAMSASRAVVRRRLPTRSHRPRTSTTSGQKPPVARARAATTAASAMGRPAHPPVPSNPHRRPTPSHVPPPKPAKAPAASARGNAAGTSHVSGSGAESAQRGVDESGSGSGSSADGPATSAEPEVKRRNKRFSIGKSLRRLSRRLSSADIADSLPKTSTPNTAVPEMKEGSGEDKGGDVAAWDVDQVCTWLQQVQDGDFAKYADAFRQQAINGKLLLECDNTDALKNLGVKSIGHRTILKKLISDLSSP